MNKSKQIPLMKRKKQKEKAADLMLPCRENEERVENRLDTF